MAHGYLEDGYGIGGGMDRDGDDERDRRWRDRDRDRGTMFEGRGRDPSDEDRWSDRGWRSEQGGFGDRPEGRNRFSANPDDHYRSWRDRHMSELDRDYADYCREREQQFHSNFDRWRGQRHSNPQPLRTGMTQSGLSHDPTGELQLETEARAPIEPDPVADATLGTNAARGAPTGRGRR
jgi:hypothetical protein